LPVAVTERVAVDPGDGAAQVQGDAVVGVPLQVVEDDVLDRHLAGQHRGEQDAVVVGVGLGAKHRDVVHLRCDLPQLFQRADARHPVADHDQFEFAHDSSDD
jgi:hypothetical protein